MRHLEVQVLFRFVPLAFLDEEVAIVENDEVAINVVCWIVSVGLQGMTSEIRCTFLGELNQSLPAIPICNVFLDLY